MTNSQAKHKQNHNYVKNNHSYLLLVKNINEKNTQRADLHQDHWLWLNLYYSSAGYTYFLWAGLFIIADWWRLQQQGQGGLARATDKNKQCGRVNSTDEKKGQTLMMYCCIATQNKSLACWECSTKSPNSPELQTANDNDCINGHRLCQLLCIVTADTETCKLAALLGIMPLAQVTKWSSNVQFPGPGQQNFGKIYQIVVKLKWVHHNEGLSEAQL